MHLIALVPLVGDHAAAAVLAQIMYWHQGRLRVQHKGTYWLAKSRADMCAETAITLDQYKRIMPLLVKQGWIVTERHLFKNKVTPFIRLTERGLVAAGLAGVIPKPLVKKSHKSPGVSPTKPSGVDATNPSTGTTTGTTTGTMALVDDIDQNGGEVHKQGGTYEVEEEGNSTKKESSNTGKKAVYAKDELAMKAVDILKAHQAPVNGSLGGFWHSRMKLVKDGFQQPLTGQEQGQLKHLQKSLGDQTKPVIAYAISHWWKFASEAGASAGVSFPADPQIGFLLKHHAVAVNLLTHEVQTPSLPMEAPVQLIATGTETEPVHTLTSQELTELLDGLKSP